MGVRHVGNGQAAVNDALTEESQQPPWWNVDPKHALVDLSRQLADMTVEAALMRTYILQLHQALAAAGLVPPEEPQPDLRPA